MKFPLLFAFFLAILNICHPSQAQDKEKKILIITGDLNRPYEIVDWMFHAEEIRVEILSLGGYAGAYMKAAQSATKKIYDALLKMGADALINTRVQVVLYPAAQGQKPGDLIITGTIVKYKEEVSK